VEKLSLWDEANTKRHEETMIESWDAHFLTDKVLLFTPSLLAFATMITP
jgi:hypothetical protein